MKQSSKSGIRNSTRIGQRKQNLTRCDPSIDLSSVNNDSKFVPRNGLEQSPQTYRNYKEMTNNISKKYNRNTILIEDSSPYYVKNSGNNGG